MTMINTMWIFMWTCEMLKENNINESIYTSISHKSYYIPFQGYFGQILLFLLRSISKTYIIENIIIVEFMPVQIRQQTYFLFPLFKRQVPPAILRGILYDFLLFIYFVFAVWNLWANKFISTKYKIYNINVAKS